MQEQLSRAAQDAVAESGNRSVHVGTFFKQKTNVEKQYSLWRDGRAVDKIAWSDFEQSSF
jgi:hypothetical protein